MVEQPDVERSALNLRTLLNICARPGKVLVLMQNNPDPDAIASAATVRDLVHEHLKKRVTIGYGGVIGRAENRAMVRELHIDVRHTDQAALARYKTLCLVDTQPRAGNNALYTTRPADIVIDHHIPPKKPLWQARLTDVRPGYGASSTILFEYVQASGMKPSVKLATALYYGVQSDTQELGREASPADIAAFQQLVPLADKAKLARIRRAPVGPEYFEKLRDGLSNAVVAGTTVITLIRDCSNPDMFAEVADMMLRLEGIRTSVCYGPWGDMIFLSARAADARGNTAARMKRVVSRLGTGGGHRSMAGGQIPIIGDIEKRLHAIHCRILKYFAPTKTCRALLPEGPKTGAAEGK